MASLTSSKVKESIFTTTVALFIVPAYIYLCSFQYERGMCDFYGIPQDLIKPDLTTNLSYSIKIFVVVYIVYFLPHYMGLSFFYQKVNKNPYLHPYLRANTLIAIIVLGFTFTATSEIDWYKTFLLLLFVVFPIINLLAYSQAIHIKKELENKDYTTIATEWNADKKILLPILDFPDILNIKAIFNNIQDKHKSVLLLMIIIVCISYYIGKNDAYKKKIYEVSADKKSLVLLKKYGDDIIIENFDIKTKKLKDSLILLKLGPANPQTFVRKLIGPLKSSNY